MASRALRVSLSVVLISTFSCTTPPKRIATAGVFTSEIKAQFAEQDKWSEAYKPAKFASLPPKALRSSGRSPAAADQENEVPPGIIDGGANRPNNYVIKQAARPAANATLATKFKKRAATLELRHRLSQGQPAADSKKSMNIIGIPTSLQISSSKKRKIRTKARARAEKRTELGEIQVAGSNSDTVSATPKSLATTPGSTITLRKKPTTATAKTASAMQPAAATAAAVTDPWLYFTQNVWFTNLDYVNNMNQTWYTYFGGSTTDYIKVDFDYVDMESGYDFVKIYDEFGLCVTYSGSMSDFASVTCSGNFVQIVVTTDGSVSGGSYDGFHIRGFYEYIPSGGTFNEAPIALARANKYTARVGEAIAFNGLDSFDPENDPIFFDWSFGDGFFSSFATANHAYSSPGDYFVQLRVEDSFGAASTDSFLVHIIANPPSADFTFKATTISTTNLATIYINPTTATSLQVDWGDNSTTTLNPYTPSAQGISHKYAAAGNYIVTVKATNSGGTNTQMATIRVTGISQPPTIGLASITEAQGTSYNLTSKYVLADDGNLKQMQINYGAGPLINPIATLTQAMLAPTFSAGRYTVNQKYTYQRLLNNIPKAYAGSFGVQASVTDEDNLTQATNFSYTTLNKAPVVNGTVIKKICMAQSCEFIFGDISAPFINNVYDLDGDVTEVRWDFFEANKLTPVTGCPTVLNAQSVNCNFPHTGTFWIRFRAIDNMGLFTDLLFSQAVVNKPPVVTVAGINKSCKSLSCQYKFLDPMSKYVLDTDGSVVSYNWSFLKADKVTPVPGCAAVSNTNLASCMFPSNGTYYLKFVATDNYGLSTTALVALALANKAPVIVPTQMTRVCNSLSCNFTMGAADFSKAVYDPDGQIQSYEWEFLKADKITPVPGCLLVSNINSGICVFPANGTYQIRFKATDNSGLSTQMYIPVTIANKPPVITAAGVIKSCQSLSCQFTLGPAAIKDPDGILGSYSWQLMNADKITPVPGCAVVNNAPTGSCVFSGNGTYQMFVTLTDNSGLTTQGFVPIVIANRAPTINAAGLIRSCVGLICNYRFGTVAQNIDMFVKDPDGTVANYSWNFVMADKVTPVAGCSTVNNTNAAACTYPAVGTYYVKFTATDNSGLSTTAFLPK